MNNEFNQHIVDVSGGGNVAYILNDNAIFSYTGYKVIQNHSKMGLLRCAKLNYNGKIKLIYLVGEYKPLSYLFTKLGTKEMKAIISNLIQNVIEVKSNGFFRLENLELDLNKIFASPADGSVYMIYLPLSSCNMVDGSDFETEFKDLLIKLLKMIPEMASPQFDELCNELATNMVPMERIMKFLNDSIDGECIFLEKKNYTDGQSDISKGVTEETVMQEVITPQRKTQPQMKITSINSPVQLNFEVNKPEYVLGKQSNMVDGVVMYNPAISRIHCKVIYENERYYLSDMGSVNGTFVNHQRVYQNHKVEIKNGDHIRLANSEFTISY